MKRKKLCSGFYRNNPHVALSKAGALFQNQNQNQNQNGVLSKAGALSAFFELKKSF